MIIALSCVVTTITGISMSAICTNGVVRGGKAAKFQDKDKGTKFQTTPEYDLLKHFLFVLGFFLKLYLTYPDIKSTSH